MFKYNLASAHKMVNEQSSLGNDVRWDGYDIVFFRGNPNNPEATAHALYSENGAYRNNVWGFENRIKVNEEGVWEIDPRNLFRRRKNKF